LISDEGKLRRILADSLEYDIEFNEQASRSVRVAGVIPSKRVIDIRLRAGTNDEAGHELLTSGIFTLQFSANLAPGAAGGGVRAKGLETFLKKFALPVWNR